jgi:hypothetical protein
MYLLGLLDREDEGAVVFQNTGKCLPSDTASHPRRLESFDCVLYAVQVQAKGAVDNIKVTTETYCVVREIQSDAEETFENLNIKI